MGAGILPMTVIKGSLFFLLGREKSGYWCDFGGTSNINESNINTAIREGYEELDGFFGNKKQLKEIVTNNLVSVYKTDRYTTFCFYVKCENIIQLPYYFNNHRKFLDTEIEYEDQEGMFEKNEIKLFSINELQKDNSIIRPFYRDIVNQVIYEKHLYYHNN